MPRELPELIAALAFFGAVVILPLVFMLLRHQRAIASMIHENHSEDALKRIDALEREVRELKVAQQVRSIQATERRELPH